MINLVNYFWNLETPVFIFYVFITEIYLTSIWRDNWRSVFDVVKGLHLCWVIISNENSPCALYYDHKKIEKKRALDELI